MTDEEIEWMVSVNAIMIVEAKDAEEAKQLAENSLAPEPSDVEEAVNAVPRDPEIPDEGVRG